MHGIELIFSLSASPCFPAGNLSLPAKDQMITAEPDLARITLVPEDEFLVLACDGIWDCLSNQECVDFVRSRLEAWKEKKREWDPLSKIAEEMLDACLADDPRKTTGVGGDNMTCLIVQLKARPGLKRAGDVKREGPAVGEEQISS